MPKRNRIKVFIGGPQGDDASLTIKLSTIGELKVSQKNIKNLRDSGDEDSADKASRETLSKSIMTWNWVDDDGEQLDLPSKNLDVFDELTSEEMQYIGNCLSNNTPSQVVAKKSG